MHQDEKSDMRTGESLAEALVEGFTKAGAPAAGTSAPYVCGQCRKGFKQAKRLVSHVKECKERANGTQDEAEG